MAQWDELGYCLSASRVLYLFDGWTRACELAGLEDHGFSSTVNLRQFGKARQMVTAQGHADWHDGAVKHYGVPVEGPI